MDYSKHYDLLIERARNRVPPEGYIERHHVIPRCLGGSDDESNLVALTPEEHYLAHLLLIKVYPENRSLVYAANKMTVGSKTTRRNNKRYGWLKRRYSEVRKKDAAGSGNTQYGTMWINKIGTTENKKIDKSDDIPNGWQKGRVFRIKTKECKMCGQTECLDKKTCSRHQTVKTFVEYLGFDSSVIGTPSFYDEFNRIVDMLRQEYDNGMSIEKIKEKYNFTTNERVRKMFISLGIDRRTISEALSYL